MKSQLKSSPSQVTSVLAWPATGCHMYVVVRVRAGGTPRLVRPGQPREPLSARRQQRARAGQHAEIEHGLCPAGLTGHGDRQGGRVELAFPV